MKHTNLLLGHLFVMIALGCPSSSAGVILGEKGMIDVTGNTAMFALKGQVDPTGASHMRKLGLRVKAPEEEEGASIEELQTNIVQKKKMTMIVTRALKFTDFVIPRSSSVSNTNSKYSQDSNPVPERQFSEEPQGTTQKDKTQNNVAKEIMNLIHKDYKGEAARRRSPINNQEPRN